MFENTNNGIRKFDTFDLSQQIFQYKIVVDGNA
jgi:hypothetical protein